MTHTNLELKKTVINRAYKNRIITKEQFDSIMSKLSAEEEELRRQQTLRSFKKKELIEKYLELSHF